ncbi:MAG: sugar porter family MFS transporter [Bacteroidales bacterium]|jgi:sugar porter (SP) family MFS transporter
MPSPRLYLAMNSFSAALGGLLFGFDTAVISGTIPFITKYFTLSDAMLGWAVSTALIGCVVGSLSVGKPGDLFGRRLMLKIMALLFIVSAVGTGLANSLTVFVLFRFIGGLAIGGASVLAPMYISEIAPARMRGRLVAINQLAIVTGILLAFFSNYLLVNTGDYNWRWMFIAGAVPALLFFILLFFVSQSPRWLVLMGRPDDARKVIARLNPGTDIEPELNEIIQSTRSNESGIRVKIFRKPYTRIVLIGMMLGVFSQLTGINVIMYYAPSIFQAAGFSSDSALIQTVIIGATNLVFTLLGMSLIDKIGRKVLLMAGALGMAFFLGLIALGMTYQFLGGFVLLACVVGFTASFASTMGVVVWVFLSEMFPNSIRSRGTAISSFAVWVANCATAFLFPIVMGHFGTAPVFGFYCLATLISFFFYWRYLVETKGKSLEELEDIVLRRRGTEEDETVRL